MEKGQVKSMYLVEGDMGSKRATRLVFNIVCIAINNREYIRQKSQPFFV